MGYSYKPVFNKNNIKTKSGLFSIHIRVTVHRQSIYLNTGERIEERHWSEKDNLWVKPTHPVAFEINAIIRHKLSLLQKYEYRQKLAGNEITLTGFAEAFKRNADSNSFNTFAENFIKNVRGRSLNTLKKYRTFLSYLNQFNPHITFGQINEPLFQRFAAWLEKEKNLMGTSIRKYFDPWKVVTRQAVKEGYLEKNPFQYADLAVKATRGTRVYLDIEEIKSMRYAPLPEERQDLYHVRTWWLFCFYAGFYYNDLRTLRWEDVKQTEHGPVIVGNRFKNENMFISPVHKFQHAIQILESQKGKDVELVFPEAISEQKFNTKLKELAKLAGINKRLMNKTARHSTVQFWEAMGLETQHTAKIVGHTKESTTKQYYELSVRDINNRVAKFDLTSLGL